ncbi:hypothetical protein EDB86DRAFT_10990 [Lactarius hatsudake]|nr:hypothetical protein EDB86DRAFT_10990 [Lactarius hatsudake]
MRRIASVLTSRRSDKPDPPNDAHPRPTSKSFANSSTRRFFGTLTRITVSTDRSSQPTASEPAHSSSASSTGSVSLRTPEDDRMGQLAPHVARSSSQRKAWIPWLAPKKSDPRGQSPSHPPSSYWPDSSGPIPSSSIAVSNQPTESEDDTSDESSSSESGSPSTSPPVPSRVDKPDPHLSPVDFVASLTMNNIPPAFSPPPLLHYSDAPLFPRSSNSMHRLTFCDTIESTMHRKRLLHRLQSLTPVDRRLLAALGPRILSAAQRRTLLQPEEGERYDLKHVQPFSLGLKQWISRPYFEERTVLWVPDDAGTVVRTTVKGSGFGVWALDVPETLELLAGLDNFDIDDVRPSNPLPPPSNNVPPALTSLPPVTGKPVPYKAVPSPLRYDRGFSEPPTPPSSTEAMTPASTSTVSSSRRGVRFAESVDKEDQVPLGYILRHRKRREEKALFIQQERERRQHEEERLKHEAERQQWEQEKRQWQKEKRALDEAKRQKKYAEEIAAARVRRESHYALPSQAREQDSRSREAYSRPAYDPRKQTEHASQAHSLRSRNDSSSSSRQDSLPRSESAGPHTSRATSTHSISSSEDVRARASRNSRRGSMISESSQRSVTSPFFAYGWPPVPPISQIPPIPIFPVMQVMPMVPQFTMDTPLLPPTAPFMRQQYSRSRSRDSSPSRGTGPSRGERPQRSSDPVPPKPRHHRSSSDEYGGRNSPARSHAQMSSSSTHPRPVYPRRTEPSSRASMPSTMPQQPFAPRRQTALS